MRSHSHCCCFRSVPTYFVPQVIQQKVEQAKSAMEALDGEERQSPMKIVGVKPGEEYDLSIRGLFVRVFAVTHGSCPAVGYVIGSRLDATLKPEYRGLTKTKIRELVTSGVAVKTEPTEIFHVAYTGDTSVEGLLAKTPTEGDETEHKNALYLQQAFQCQMLLCEATFLDDSDKSRELSAKRAHLHIQDIARVLQDYKFAKGDRQVVLLHISARYSAKAALDHIAEAVPSNVANHCLVAISSHLDNFGRDKAWRRLVRNNGCILLSDYMAAVRRKSQRS